MAEPIWLGLDLGTQSARAVAVTGQGEVVGSASRPLTSRRSGLEHEQDPREWFDALAGACREALAATGGARVGGVALCATSGTVVLVGPDGAPVSPALMYDDARAAGEAEEVNAAGAAVWSSLGYGRMPATWALPKVLWLTRHGHGLDGARLAHQADVVTAQLVGRRVPADASHALKTGYDVVHERWPLHVMARLGLTASLLGDVVRAGSRLGVVGHEAAQATGIPEGTPVVAGMTDGCAAQLAAGSLTDGSWNAVLGTTLVLKGASRKLLKDRAGVVYSHRAPGGGWLPGGASSVGAGVLSDRFGGRDLAALDAQAAEREPASVVSYPLVGRGERFPFQAPEAEGFTLGQPADEVERYASLLQGVAFAERLMFDYLDGLGAPIDGPLSLTGGGARSRYWCQLRADVLRHPVRLPRTGEGAAGMAVLAAASVTGRPLSQVAAEMVHVEEELRPRPDHVDRFRAPFGRLVDELQRRGWLDAAVAEHSRRRAAAA